MTDYKKKKEYLLWLANRMHRKFDGHQFTCFTDGTASEVGSVLAKIKDHYYIRTTQETCRFSDGTEKEVQLLYVRTKPSPPLNI
jgi:hypothetical protein